MVVESCLENPKDDVLEWEALGVGRSNQQIQSWEMITKGEVAFFFAERNKITKFWHKISIVSMD